MAFKILRGHLHTPADNPLDDYRSPAQRDAAAAAAREQRGQAQVDGNAAGGRWHGRRP